MQNDVYQEETYAIYIIDRKSCYVLDNWQFTHLKLILVITGSAK